MKYSDGGVVDRPKKKRGSLPVASSINFGSDSGGGGSIPRSCNPNAPNNTAAAGGSGITVNKAGKSCSRADQKAGTLSSKRQFDRSRMVSAREMQRQKEREQKKNMRARKRSDKPQSNPRTLGVTHSFDS